MSKSSIAININQLSRLFPISLLLNKEYKIVSFGSGVQGFANVNKEHSIFDYFEINSLELNKISFDETRIDDAQTINVFIKNKGEFSFYIEYFVDDELVFLYLKGETQALIIENQIENSSKNKKEENLDIEKLSLVASSNENGVLYVDEKGCIFWSNESFLKISGFSHEEIIGKTPLEICSGPNIDKRELASMSAAFKKGKSIDKVLALYRKDGTCFWGRIKAQSNQTQSLTKNQYFAIVEDITAEIVARFELLKSEKRLTSLISNLQTGILLEDEKNTIVLSNQKFQQMFGDGFSPNSLIGTNSFDSAERRKALFINSDHFIFRKSEILSARKMVVDEELTLKDGRILSRDYVPIFVEDEYKGHLWTYTDVTIKKDTEITLRKREEKYRSIIANMNLGLVEVDMHERILYANQCFCDMSGYDFEDLIDNTTIELFISDKYVNILKTQNENRKKGESDTYEIAARNKRGELRWWLISGAPRLNEQSEIIGTIGIFLDITQQKFLENELIEAKKLAEESSKAKESFLANMSHEIRTPLNAIIGMVRELSRNSDDNLQHSYLNNAETAAKHLLSIINNILDISKIEAGEFELDTRHFSLRDVINETVTIVSVNAKEKSLGIEVDVSENIQPVLIGDDSRMRQILINLIGNSIKFTDQGKIKIKCTAEDVPGLMQKIRLSITDTGVGMNREYLENLFNKFSQEDKSIARKFGGTGLGMAITYELVQLMGGRMDVFSEKNSGTTIFIELNLKIGDVKKMKPVVVETDFTKLNSIKVLLVEDNEWNRLVALNSLSLYNIKAVEAENGIEAIEELKKNKFDIILMDLQMPIMDGIEATKEIRNTLKIDTPIIALTANALKKEIDYCLVNGFNDFIIKPFEEETFFSVILKNLRIDNSKKMTTEKEHVGGPLYDIEKLVEASRGNKWFVDKMIKIFVDQTNSAIDSINMAYKLRDFKSIKEIAHRIKPSIDNMCINSIREEIREVERYAIEDPMNPNLSVLISKVEVVLKEVVSDLSKKML